jgi:hypothetical protein
MGKPVSKASEGDAFDVLGERGDVTKSEVAWVSGMYVLARPAVRPEAFPPGLPMSVSRGFLQQ